MSDTPPPNDAGWPPPPSSGLPPPPPPGFGAPPPPGYAAYSPTGPAVASGSAGFWIRFLAVIIDGLIIGIPFWILGSMFADDTTTRTFSNGSTTQTDTGFNISFGWNSAAPLWLNTLNTLVTLTYFGYFEGGLTGQTLGKRVAGIRVVDANTGQPGIGFGRAVGRYFARILSAIPCLLGYFWMLWDARKQTWHDKLVNTVVVKG
jgi:uncharacterized RDD family membrane protein YckC